MSFYFAMDAGKFLLFLSFTTTVLRNQKGEGGILELFSICLEL